MTSRSPEASSAAICHRLRQLDSCAVSDALDGLGLSGVAEGIAPVSPVSRVAGRVLTVELGPASGSPSARHLCTSAIETARPGDVILVAHQGRLDCAGWGGNLSRAAVHRGLTATIVHGAVRDVDETTAVGYPLFATGVTPRTARGRAQERSWGEPVEIAALVVETGDYVIADNSGVVFIPGAQAGRVLEAAEFISGKEAAIAALIDQGDPVGQVMGEGYESLVARAQRAVCDAQ
jgi:4-hydroxy-4-methyl-2-oxoglutarate aldolase